MQTTLRLTVAAIILATSDVSAATLYVSLESTNPVAPFATWGTAATNIQDAVDASHDGDTVLVTNGVYTIGQRTMAALDAKQEPPQWVDIGPSRVVITNAITMQSVNGPQMTLVDGGKSVRCLYLGTKALFGGFTLTNGYVWQGGGGVWCASIQATLTNCAMVANWAFHSGGGVYSGTLYNCTLRGNSGVLGGGVYGSRLYSCALVGNNAHPAHCSCNCSGGGGGAAYSTLYDCTVIGNSACYGAGVFNSTLHDCTITGNSVGEGGVAQGCTLYNCTLSDNSTSEYSGAALDSTLFNCVLSRNGPTGGGGNRCAFYNCILTDNAAGSDGAFYNCTVTGDGGGISGTAFNCILYYNSGGNYVKGTTLHYCCTSPLPTNGVGNINSPPLFMAIAAGDFQLREGSPCIDSGANLVGMVIVPVVAPDSGEGSLVPYGDKPTDILGSTRFIDGNGDGKVAWDIGAYEFNSFKSPRLNLLPERTSEGWRLTIVGAPNKWVRLQWSANLRDWKDWYPLVFMGAEGLQQVTDGDPGSKVMFYRVVVR